MAREPKLGLQLRVYDESSDEDEPPTVAVGEPIVFAQPAPDAVVEEAEAPPSTSDERVRCARRKGNWQCAHLFVPRMTIQGKLQTRCERCSASGRRYDKSEGGKAAKKRVRQTDTYKANFNAYKKKWGQTEKGKAQAKRYKTGEAGKAAGKRYKAGDAGKAAVKRQDDKVSSKIRKKIRKMCCDNGIDSMSAMEATGCASTAELRAHFEATFEPWMTWTNYGTHKAGGNSGTWQIGHRLAKAFYDDSNSADIKRCWNTTNLFAQDADENHALSVTMPDDAVLERLRALDLLPCAWNGIVPPAAQRAQMERLARLPVDYR